MTEGVPYYALFFGVAGVASLAIMEWCLSKSRWNGATYFGFFAMIFLFLALSSICFPKVM